MSNGTRLNNFVPRSSSGLALKRSVMIVCTICCTALMTHAGKRCMGRANGSATRSSASSHAHEVAGMAQSANDNEGKSRKSQAGAGSERLVIILGGRG